MNYLIAQHIIKNIYLLYILNAFLSRLFFKNDCDLNFTDTVMITDRSCPHCTFFLRLAFSN